VGFADAEPPARRSSSRRCGDAQCTRDRPVALRLGSSARERRGCEAIWRFQIRCSSRSPQRECCRSVFGRLLNIHGQTPSRRSACLETAGSVRLQVDGGSGQRPCPLSTPTTLWLTEDRTSRGYCRRVSSRYNVGPVCEEVNQGEESGWVGRLGKRRSFARKLCVCIVSKAHRSPRARQSATLAAQTLPQEQMR
jgi:hypothetical protein